MPSGRDGKTKISKSKKDKQLMKIIENSDGDDDSEHELSHYLNDRVKLMKQVLKIIKPKKIKSMAPDCMKNLDNGEINSMLLEELLGISNKRLKMIFAGQTVNEDTSSSTDPEEEKKPIDIISLDDVTDDDFIIEIDSSNDDTGHNRKKQKRIKEEPPEKKIKKEKKDKSHKKDESEKPQEKSDEQNLMSVLELLELQARARAIRSQLALEASRKAQQAAQSSNPVATITVKELAESDGEDAVIVESPSFDEIIITSSESDNEGDLRKEKHVRDKHAGEPSNIQWSSKTENSASIQSGESSKLLCVDLANDSPSEIDNEKALSHGTKIKESPRKHKGMCRKRLEKYKNIKQAEQKLKRSNEGSGLLECHVDDSIDLISGDNSDVVSIKEIENCTNQESANKDISQECASQVESRLAVDSAEVAAELEANDYFKEQSDSKVNINVTENPNSTNEGCSQDLQESNKTACSGEGPSSVQDKQSCIDEKPSCIQEKPSCVRKESFDVPEKASLIQEKDSKDLLLHSQQDGLVINIDDDDMDAING